ncbi:MAG: hypothetical protein QF781_02150 [Phycisphaerales bacterium]|nr:hypothetical protein [Phycisphaerales bacterium]
MTAQHIWAVCLLAMLIPAIAKADGFPDRYVVTVLEHPEGNGTKTLVPFDLDENNRITGFAFHGYGLDMTRQPFLYSDGNLQIVPAKWDYTEGHQLAADGTAFGIDDTTDSIIHIDPSGATAVASATFGAFTGLTHVTTSGFVLGLDYDDGFVWQADIGYVRLSTLEGSTASTYAADVNESGIVVGTNNFNNGSASRAFFWDGSVLSDPAPDLSGTTRCVAVDQQDRLVLAHAPDGFWPGGGLHTIYLATLDDGTLTLDDPVASISAAYNFDVIANDHGEIAMSWHTNNEDPHLLLTEPGGIAATSLTLPPDMIAIELTGITDAGMVYGRFLDAQYTNHGFVASVESGVHLIGHRLIGAPPLSPYGTPRDANASGAMIISWGHNYNYGHWALIEPALGGDADGTWTIDINDVLSVIAAWGPQPAGSICGPDLNMDSVVDVNDLLEVLEHFDL